MTASNQELVTYRMARAQESLEDARILAEAGRWNPCVNRLYYACFYAVSALLAQEGFSSSRHTGVRALFNQHFVSTGRVTKRTAQIFHDLFERRQEGDYVDFIKFEESQVRAWMPQAEAFVTQIAHLIVPARQ